MQEILGYGTVTSTDGITRIQSIHYWEAWAVAPGMTVTVYHDRFPYDDLIAPDEEVYNNSVRGTITIHATAQFFEGLHLPSTFQRGNVPQAGPYLPSTDQNPNLQIGPTAVVRKKTLDMQNPLNQP